MKIRFQADNDFNNPIRRAILRMNPAIDFQSAPALGLHLGTPDDVVLELAAREGRMLVTHDRKTMPDHFAVFIVHHQSPGVFIVSRKLTIKQAADWLVLFWEASEMEEHVNQIINLP